MKILVAGSSGLIGSALVPFLRMEGHDVKRLLRNEDRANVVKWNAETGEISLADLEGFDAVINLAGENLASGRWTQEKKKRILRSRVDSTRHLCEALGKLKQPPKVLINASAIGYYGNRGETSLDEDSSAGKGFLADLCLQWEAATEVASKKGIRVVRLRMGVVLTPKGGALGRMLLPFKLGLGGVMGSGKQYISWIALDDLLVAIHYVLTQSDFEGAVNAVAPNPVTNRDFTKTLGRVLSRPTFFSMPAFAARLAFGEAADALILSSSRVYPKCLQDSGFSFFYPELESALNHLLV